MSRMVLVIILTMSVFGIAYACTCADDPVQKRFCSAQFAAVFHIKDNGTVIGGRFGYTQYEAELIYMYRTVLGPKAKPGYLYTPAMFSMCGVPLFEGKYYVVAGSYIDFGHPIYHRMTTNMCQVQLEFSYNPIYTFDPPECEDFNESDMY